MERDFSESIKLNAESQVDTDNGIINAVAVLSNQSRNNRIYTSQALDSVVSLIKENNTKSFLDHPVDSPSVKNLLGSFSNPKRNGNLITADLRLLQSSPGKELALELATLYPDMVGFSINGRGAFAEKQDTDGREVVEKVVHLFSIDMVSEPATVSSMFTESSQLNERIDQIVELKIRVNELENELKTARSVNEWYQGEIRKLKDRLSYEISKSNNKEDERSKEEFFNTFRRR